MWTHTHTRKHTQTHTYIHTYKYTCWHTYIHIWINTDIQTYIQTCTKTYIITTHTIHHRAVSHSLSVSPFPPLSPTDSRTHPTLTLALKHSHTELFSHRFAYTRTPLPHSHTLFITQALLTRTRTLALSSTFTLALTFTLAPSHTRTALHSEKGPDKGMERKRHMKLRVGDIDSSVGPRIWCPAWSWKPGKIETFVCTRVQ